MSKQIIGKKWCFTINNWSDNDVAQMDAVDCKYMIYGKEVGESGTPHLQGFVTFVKNKTLTSLKKLHATAHWERANGTSQQASDYCKKEGDYIERGELSVQGKRTDLERVTEMVKEGASIQKIAEECPTTYVKFGRGIRDLKLVLEKPYNHDETRGEWYWGPPGTGKSRKARDENPDAYLKAQNKWFDGYNGEDVIILDDLDIAQLGHHLKIWTDRYACTGETKGGTIHLRHKKFIVTSNYSIEQLWPDDQPMQEAIKRRFKVTHFNDILTPKRKKQKTDKITNGYSHSSTFNFPN